MTSDTHCWGLLQAFTTGRNATEGVHDLVRNVGEDRDQTTNSSRRSIQAKHMRHHQSDNLLSFPEQGFTSDFVPIQVKDEKLNYDLGSTDHHARNEHSDLSAGTASCLDTVQDQSASRCCFVVCVILVISTQITVWLFCEGDKLVCSQEDKKKKVGRPIAYRGDPNAMSLTDTERRRIKRRIANRESARRVRARRQGILEELEVEVSYACSIQQSTTLSCAFNADLAAPACLALVSCRILFGQPACLVVCRWSKSVNPMLTLRSTSLMSQGTLICSRSSCRIMSSNRTQRLQTMRVCTSRFPCSMQKYRHASCHCNVKLPVITQLCCCHVVSMLC